MASALSQACMTMLSLPGLHDSYLSRFLHSSSPPCPSWRPHGYVLPPWNQADLSLPLNSCDILDKLCHPLPTRFSFL